MTSRLQGCPFFSKHDQSPDFESNDPLAHINRGNFTRAIAIYLEKEALGAATADDYALCAHAFRNTGEFGRAAECLRKAVAGNPSHKFARSWSEQIAKNERDERSGVGIARENRLTEEYLRTDPAKAYETSPDNWVLCTDFQKPNSFTPKPNVMDRIRNTWETLQAKALVPVGMFAAMGAKAGTAGRWTEHRAEILQLAALANGRRQMAGNERDPDGERGDPPGQLEPNGIANYEGSGFTPDGARVDERFGPGEGRVGQSFVDHGMPKGYRPTDRSKNPRLPSEADVAKVFGYRNGHIVEAMTASFHAAAHLQQLVHDVAQTAPDNRKKHAIAVDPGSELAALGVTHTWSRMDAPNPLRPDATEGVHGTTVWWDMSHIYGSDIETVAATRSFPDGKHVPSGKLYLEAMDAAGNGGKWLPLVDVEGGRKQILTGMGRNMTAPLEAEHTLYARHHNWVCDVLKERYPGWSDNQIYNVARQTVTMTYVKIHTGTWTHTLFAHPAVVDGLNANLFGRAERKLRHFERKIYRPEQGDDPIAHGIAAGEVEKKNPEVKGNYFTKAYRFGHEIWVDELFCPPIGEKTNKATTRKVNMLELRELDGHEFIKKEGLGNVYYYMMNTRLGAPVDGNTADMFRDMATEEGVMSIIEQELRKDRQRGTPGFCDYQRAHGLPPMTQWAQLFTDPASGNSRRKIGELERLYPDGPETLDSRIGLILNEHRPDGFAITNEGFQTFVQEATSRIRKNPHLTERWRPEHVGWTAINLVEAIDKEKLIYLHCDDPAMKTWLENRKTTNTYEYVGTTPEEAPDEHILQSKGMVTWGRQHLKDVGLGNAWKDEHFAKNQQNDMLRVDHAPTGQSYIVDLTEKVVLGDVDGDGRIQQREVLRRDPEAVTLKEIIAAAEAIRAETRIPWPGYESSACPGFTSGWRLTQREVNRLKGYHREDDTVGVPARLTDLERHFLLFNLGDDIEKASFKENLQGWRVLEESGTRAFLMALGSTYKFGSMMRGQIKMRPAEIADRRPAKSTGIFGKDGMIDRGRLELLRGAVKDLAARHAGGSIPEAALMKMLGQLDALDSLTRRQWGSLFRLVNRVTGRRELTPELFDKFYSGQLLFEAFEKFAPRELKDRLAAAAPISDRS